MSRFAHANFVPISYVFPYQSWFDQTLLQNAIAQQPQNTPIVTFGSPTGTVQQPGAALTLHPSSEVPVAVQVKGESGVGASPTIIIVPGQTVSPLGTNKFRSLQWGLPFGWLGGGMATLLVSQADYQPEGVTARPEIVMHRATFPILQPSQLVSSGAGNSNNSALNWPGRFPWNNAIAIVSAANVSQAGSPNIKPEPTRIVMTLRGASTLAAPANMRAIIQGSNEFDLDAGGVAQALTLTNPSYQDFTWPAFASFGTSGNLATQNPTLDVDESSPLCRLAADNAGVTFVDVSGSEALDGLFVDIVRYGRL